MASREVFDNLMTLASLQEDNTRLIEQINDLKEKNQQLDDLVGKLGFEKIEERKDLQEQINLLNDLQRETNIEINRYSVTNKRLLKAVAALAVENRQQRDALQVFCDWNASQDGLSTDAGLKRLSRALDQAGRVLNQKPTEIPEEVWDATD